MLRWNVCRLAKRLIDDLPRKLTDFEKSKIVKSLTHALALVPEVDRPDSSPFIPEPVLPDKESLVLGNLASWPLPLALKALLELLSVSKYRVAIGSDARFLRFVARLFSPGWEATKSTLALLDLLDIITAVAPLSERIPLILNELVLKRDAESLAPEELIRVIRAAKLCPLEIPRITAQLVQIVEQSCNIDLLIEAAPLGLPTGKLLVPTSMLPVLSKAELIQLLTGLDKCELPDTIVTGVAAISDALTRLSFNRLVTDEEKNQVMWTLFKLKTKLDRMAFVDNNPFYVKDKRNNFLGKICRTLSYDFQHAAVTLSLPVAASRMLALSGLNALQLKSVDLIANRITSFGDKLMHPAALSATEFTALVYTITNHPQSWKRTDKYRASIAAPLSKALYLQLEAGRLSPHQTVTCCQCLMTIHNTPVRSAVAEALVRLDTQTLSPVELLSLAHISATLIKHDDRTIQLIIKFVNEIPLQRLNTPQLVDLLGVCRDARIVTRADETLMALQQRLQETGGLISPTNAVKVISAVGDLQVRNIGQVVDHLVSIALEVSEMHPRLSARLLTGLTMASVCNPEITAMTNSVSSQLLLNMSSPESLKEILTDVRLTRKLYRSLELLGAEGGVFRSHLTAIPAPSTESLVGVEPGSVVPSLNDELMSVAIETGADKEELLRTLPSSTALVGDLLAALMPVSGASADSGGFELEGPRTWTHLDHRVRVTIIRPRQCARDDPRRILGSAAAQIASERLKGWQVVVLPEFAIESLHQSGMDAIKKRVRRAKIIHKDVDTFTNLLNQLKEILSS